MSALRKNIGSQVLTFNLVNATTGAALASATVTVKVALDGTQSAGAGTVTELGTGQYKYVPTQGETNGTSVGFSFTATNAVPVNLHCFTIGQDPTQTTFQVDVAKWLGTAASTPTVAGVPNVNVKTWNDLATVALPLVPATAGRSLVVDADGLADANVVKLGPTGSGTAQTARDVGASVLLSSGTGTGQLDFTGGVVKANLTQILGTLLTETAGLIAAGFKKFFNVATPTGTLNSLPGTVAGLPTGLPITDANNEVAASTLRTNNDKTGYALTSGYDPAKTAAQAGDAMALTSGERTTLTAAIWAALTSALTTVGSIGKLLVDNIDATISSRTKPADTQARVTLVDTVTTLTNAPSDSSGVTTLLSRIPSGLFTGITSLAQWLGLIAGKQTGNSTARTELRATGGGSGTFDETTDSLEAVRDRGDAAWATATGFSTLDGAGVRSAVGLASANLDTQIDALPTNGELATALASADDAVLAAIAALSIPTANQTADALLDRTDAIETALTVREALRVIAAACAGKASGLATTTATYRNALADSKDRIVATVDADGNRTAVTLDVTP